MKFQINACKSKNNNYICNRLFGKRKGRRKPKRNSLIAFKAARQQKCR